VLFSYADGKKVRNLTEKTCFSIGSLMANIHKTTINQEIKRIEYNAHTLTQLPYQYATKHFSESNEEMQFVKSASEHLTELFNEVDSRELRYGVVHLDLWYDNMNIEDESFITVFDFDFCGNGWLLLDIAYFTVQLFNTEPDAKLFQSKLDSFYNGYQKVIPISNEEKALIPEAGLAIWIFYLGVQSQRFDNWSNIFLSENYLKHFIGIIKNWMKFNEITIKGANEVYV
jgi:Ser/Thr protein kinase RdoA (MazF antagonist)